MPAAIRFVHVSDLHVDHAGNAAVLPGVDGATQLRATLQRIAGLTPRPSFVLASGDLTNHGDVDSYRLLHEIMSEIGLPVLYTLGNHDRRAGFYQGLLGRGDDPAATYDYDIVVDGVHIIALDSLLPGELGGGFDEAQFGFLSAALRRHAELPKLLMFHHPPAFDLDPSEEWESLRVADTLRLAELLRGQAIVGICVGHVHKERVVHWHGVPVVHGASQYCIHDPLHSGGGMRFVTGAAFALCELRPSGLGVTYDSSPADRRELMVLSLADIRAYEARGRAAALAGH